MTTEMTNARAEEIAEILRKADDDPNTADTMIVRVTDFKRGPRYAKSMRGQYIPEIKVWRVRLSPTYRGHMRAPGMYGLSIVRAEDRESLASEVLAAA